MSNTINRRSFLKGSFAAAMAVALPNMRAVAEEKTYTYADTIAWDGEYDVVVMGFGGAGAVAANFAAKNSESVLLFDVAPKGHEGGNTRYCMQVCACGDDEESLFRYYRSMNEDFDSDDELLRVFAKGLTQVVDMFKTEYGVTDPFFLKGLPSVAWGDPEHPSAECSNSINSFVVHKGFFDGALWNAVRTKAIENKNVDVLYEARGAHLIQEPETKTIIGIAIEKDGKLIYIRAKNGVIMTCGGFENNPKMVKNYLNLPNTNPRGSLYNRGDGVKMAMEINADLWHMGSYESGDKLGGLCLDLGESVRAQCFDITTGSLIVVGTNGQRYVSETYQTRHGRVPYYGNFQMPPHPRRSYLILDEKQMQAFTNEGQITEDAKSVMTTASSFAEMAEKLNLPLLLETVEKYNSYAVNGYDPEFFRAPEEMQPLTDGPCYAFRMVPYLLNTQGGARRNARAEVLDVNGNVIPHLYSAGEFGGLTAHYYQGSTNIAECMIFGRIAGENAAATKEPLAAYAPREAVASTLTYTLGCTEEVAATYEAAEGEYIGKGTGIGGDVVVKCKIENGAVASCEVIQQTETEGISTPALNTLPAKFVGCKTADEVNAIDAVSGATITSKALKAAVIDCLTQSAGK